MKILIRAAAATVLSLAAPAFAQAAAPAPPAASAPVDPAALEAARSLLRASGYESQMEQTGRQNAAATFETMMATLARQKAEPIPEDLKATVRAIIMEDVEGLIAEMKLTGLDKAAAVYARYFTADELRELERLQSVPVMVKFREVGPSFMTELTQIGIAAAAERMPAMREKIRIAVEAWAASRSAPQRRGGRRS